MIKKSLFKISIYFKIDYSQKKACIYSCKLWRCFFACKNGQDKKVVYAITPDSLWLKNKVVPYHLYQVAQARLRYPK